jgi:Protein of unknown function (DUF2971)
MTLQDTLAEITSLRTRFEENLRHRRPIFGNLYHYNSLDALRGMLDSKQIWFTDVKHLNDPSELEHGIRLAKTAVQQAAAAAAAAEPVAEFIKPLFSDKLTVLLRSASFCTACFSVDADDLGQWRAYGDNGSGVAIGFRNDIFEDDSTDANSPHVRIASMAVEYSEETAIEGMKSFLTEFGQSILKLSHLGMLDAVDENNRTIKDTCRLQATESLLMAALAIKHKAYKNEAEVRFIKQIDVKPGSHKFRTRKSAIVPYCEVPFNPTRDIKSVTLGPAASPHLVDGLRKLLIVNHQLEDVQVTQSPIPYRP